MHLRPPPARASEPVADDPRGIDPERGVVLAQADGDDAQTVAHLPDSMGFGWEDETVWLARAHYPKASDARTFYAKHTGAFWIEVRVLARWARHDPQAFEPEWWSECARDHPGAFPVWRCE